MKATSVSKVLYGSWIWYRGMKLRLCRDHYNIPVQYGITEDVTEGTHGEVFAPTLVMIPKDAIVEVEDETNIRESRIMR